MKAKLLFSFFVFVFVFSACKKKKVLTDSSASIELSADSVLFDTVFTARGSTTKLFKIYNTHKQPIRISKAYVAAGSASQFRLNIDGVSGYTHNDIEILADDSLFAFVQVTIDPNNSNAPLLVKDSIVFETNGNSQKVLLTAVGQDVYLHKPDVFPTSGESPYSTITTSIPWTNDKPHLIIGVTVVDEGEVLTMEAGTRVYMNTDAQLRVSARSSLKINGTKGNEVTFQGARLEEDYADIPGQWGKIWLMQNSKENVIDWAVIKNGSVGIQVDSLGAINTPVLTLSNTKISNMSAAAIYGEEAHLKAYNCLMYNCGQYLAAFTKGGKVQFEHCTFANYWNGGARSTPSVYLNNYSFINGESSNYNLDSAHFVNCIVDGNLTDEIGLDFRSGGGSENYSFRHSMLKTTLETSNNVPFFENVFKNESPDFENTEEEDYHLKATSFGIDRGATTLIVLDLDENVRPNTSTSIPDLGAFEY